MADNLEKQYSVVYLNSRWSRMKTPLESISFGPMSYQSAFAKLTSLATSLSPHIQVNNMGDLYFGEKLVCSYGTPQGSVVLSRGQILTLKQDG